MHDDPDHWWLAFLRPRFWPTWMLFLLGWSVTRLPFSLQMHLGRLIGRLAHRLARQRRAVARTNLRLCFPELDARQQHARLKAHFLALGQGIVETALSWWGADAGLPPRCTLIGAEHLQAARRRGRGVILLSAHFTTLELGGRLLARHEPFHVLYRPHNNPLFETIMQRSRARRFQSAIPRSATRTLIQRLKANEVVWYAPDQNYHGKHACFAPFFGIPASTLTAPSRLARLSGAAVVPFFQARLPDDSGYLLVLCPALHDFPGDDAGADAARINRLIEDVVREIPEQYLWVHRRFKTRPAGEQPLYP